MRFCIYTEGWLWCAQALISFILAADSFQCAGVGGGTYILVNRDVWKKEIFLNCILVLCLSSREARAVSQTPALRFCRLKGKTAIDFKWVSNHREKFLIGAFTNKNDKGLIVQEITPSMVWACWYPHSTPRVPWVTGWGVPKPCTRAPCRTWGCSDPDAEGEMVSNPLTGQSILLQPLPGSQNVQRCTLFLCAPPNTSVLKAIKHKFSCTLTRHCFCITSAGRETQARPVRELIRIAPRITGIDFSSLSPVLQSQALCSPCGNKYQLVLE